MWLFDILSLKLLLEGKVIVFKPCWEFGCNQRKVLISVFSIIFSVIGFHATKSNQTWLQICWLVHFFSLVYCEMRVHLDFRFVSISTVLNIKLKGQSPHARSVFTRVGWSSSFIFCQPKCFKNVSSAAPRARMAEVVMISSSCGTDENWERLTDYGLEGGKCLFEKCSLVQTWASHLLSAPQMQIEYF